MYDCIVLLVHVYDVAGQRMHLTDNLRMIPVSRYAKASSGSFAKRQYGVDGIFNGPICARQVKSRFLKKTFVCPRITQRERVFRRWDDKYMQEIIKAASGKAYDEKIAGAFQ